MKTITPKGFGAPLGMYSHGVVASPGELVVVAGQVGMGPNGQVAVGDIVAQTKQAFENVRSVIEAGGCSMRDVVRLQTFLTRGDDIAAFMKTRAEIFPEYFPDGVYPPNTLLVISQLVRPELLIEIEAIAVRRKGRAAPTPRPRKTAAVARRRSRR
jgi:2-iminobutanoate/2-iminopropanoate deaminase